MRASLRSWLKPLKVRARAASYRAGKSQYPRSDETAAMMFRYAKTAALWIRVTRKMAHAPRGEVRTEAAASVTHWPNSCRPVVVELIIDQVQSRRGSSAGPQNSQSNSERKPRKEPAVVAVPRGLLSLRAPRFPPISAGGGSGKSARGRAAEHSTK